MARKQQLIVYIDDETSTRIRDVAASRGESSSAFAKGILVAAIGSQQDDREHILKSVARLEIAVDALVKHHPNGNLFEIVRATQKARIGSVSRDG